MKGRTLLILAILMIPMASHAQRLLSPTDWRTVSDVYNATVDSLLWDSDARMSCVVRPSFSPEYSLLIYEDRVDVRYADYQIFSFLESQKCPPSLKQRFFGEVPGEVHVSTMSMEIDREMFRIIRGLFASAVYSSSYLCYNIGCDGETYEFGVNGWTASCWSPEVGSNCHELVDITETLIDAVRRGSVDSIVAQQERMSALTETFKSLICVIPLGFVNEFQKSEDKGFAPPEFKGGDMGSFKKWVMNNTDWSCLKEFDCIGRILVSFTVDEKGRIRNATIVRGLEPHVDAAILQTVGSSPKWKPARENNRPVSSEQSVELIVMLK